ncbi:MAG: hypothetical protein WB870_06780 [Gallionellaceae bacterium]
MSLPESRIIRLFQLGKQKFFNVSRHADASDNAWPKFDQRRDYQFARQRDDMQVVVEVIAATAVLRLAKGTCVTFPIVTNAADVIPAVVGEENDGARRGAASRKSRLRQARWRTRSPRCGCAGIGVDPVYVWGLPRTPWSRR